MSEHYGVSCIGRMARGKNDWFAELDFNNNEATVVRRGKDGSNIGPIATMPLGEVWEENDDYDAELMDNEQNRNLMLVVFAPELVEQLKSIRDQCRASLAISDEYDNETADRAMVLIESIKDEIEDTLTETLSVPEPDNPEHLAEVEAHNA